MIIGILVKVSSIIIERKTFTKSAPMIKYWKKMRSKYKDANFFIYRATHPVQEINRYNNKSTRYCPYCEEIRDFIPGEYERVCPVCDISIDNFSVKTCNLPREED